MVMGGRKLSCGVCEIEMKNEYQFYSGGFDEYVRLYDLRYPKKNLYNIRMKDGGVWRLKVRNTKQGQTYIACGLAYKNSFAILQELNNTSCKPSPLC
jgi:hypothetical protein